MKVPEGMTDEEVLFLTDIFPTGYMGAEHAEIKGGDIVAIWGAGPVGIFAIQSAKGMGAERIIAIETVPERIAMAKRAGATDIIDFVNEDVYERIKEISKGEGADSVIDSAFRTNFRLDVQEIESLWLTMASPICQFLIIHLLLGIGDCMHTKER